MSKIRYAVVNPTERGVRIPPNKFLRCETGNIERLNNVEVKTGNYGYSIEINRKGQCFITRDIGNGKIDRRPISKEKARRLLENSKKLAGEGNSKED